MQCPRRRESWVGSSPQFARDDDTGLDGRCTYCGSLLSDQLFTAIIAGVEIVPTDKNYKIYVGNDKFYFQHLSIPDRHRFIDLYNDQTIKMCVPGYFYVLPFFMKIAEA